MKLQRTFFLSLFVSGSAFAQLTTYTYNRRLDNITKEDFYSIPLSPDIIAHSRSGLNDLRIYTIGENDTTEVPYLTEWLGNKVQETPVNFELINDVTNKKCCSYVTLKMQKTKVINTINLDIVESNFDKILTLEGSNDNKEWFTIRKHLRITGFDNSSVNFRSTTIHFPSAEYSYFRIAFDDDASERVTVNNASVFENTVTKGNYDELTITGKTQAENKKEKTSEVIIRLKDTYMVNHMTLNSGSKIDFYRDVNIYRSTGTYHSAKGDIEGWEMVSSGVLVSGEENSFDLGNVQTNKLKVEIINYDNQPIELDKVKAYSEKIALTAKLPADNNIYLAYGKENAEAPVYDLVHFRDKIPVSLPTVNSGKEELKAALVLNAAGEPLIKNKMWLWMVMGIVIIIIGYFALSMIRKEKENE